MPIPRCTFTLEYDGEELDSRSAIFGVKYELYLTPNGRRPNLRVCTDYSTAFHEFECDKFANIWIDENGLNVYFCYIDWIDEAHFEGFANGENTEHEITSRKEESFHTSGTLVFSGTGMYMRDAVLVVVEGVEELFPQEEEEEEEEEEEAEEE